MEITRELFDSLDAYELRLYIHCKLTANEGRIEQPLRVMAKGAGLSVTKVMQARKSLEEKGFIENRPRIVTSSAVLVK